MVQKGYGKHPEFDVEAYRRRLRILREITGGDGQTAFARRLGIAFKRWSNFERGYPLSREVAFLLHQKIPGISIEWIWFGSTEGLSQNYRDKIVVVEKFDVERQQDLAEIEKIRQGQAARDKEIEKVLRGSPKRKRRAARGGL